MNTELTPSDAADLQPPHPRARPVHRVCFFIHQNRITDAGGLALVAALPKCTLLQRLDLSYNCISEEGGRGFLNLIEGDNGNAGCSAPLEIRTEGNLFDDRSVLLA